MPIKQDLAYEVGSEIVEKVAERFDHIKNVEIKETGQRKVDDYYTTVLVVKRTDVDDKAVSFELRIDSDGIFSFAQSYIEDVPHLMKAIHREMRGGELGAKRTITMDRDSNTDDIHYLV